MDQGSVQSLTEASSGAFWLSPSSRLIQGMDHTSKTKETLQSHSSGLLFCILCIDIFPQWDQNEPVPSKLVIKSGSALRKCPNRKKEIG